MNTNDTVFDLLLLSLIPIMIIGFYYFSKWGMTTNKSIKKLSILKSIISFIFLLPITSLLMYFKPNDVDYSEIFIVVIALFILVFIFSMFISFKIIAREESKRTKRRSEENSPLPLVFIGMWMLVIIVLALGMMSGWTVKWS